MDETYRIILSPPCETAHIRKETMRELPIHTIQHRIGRHGLPQIPRCDKLADRFSEDEFWGHDREEHPF